ncbi:MAG: glycosyltransferase family 2 protein [Bacteroidales bacterium]|nr:glycosyltransferase family 2 protein [Bacteroidales bacterium]
MKVSISVVIITLNEEKNIGRCLDSIKDIADDVVVVDSFSTDKTEEICISHGARFVKHKFEGHIQQKNYAVTQAKFPHILSLDADEVLSDELIEAIKEVKENWDGDGYSMNRLNNYCGKWICHTGWYPDRKLRLWDSRKGEWSGLDPHDRYKMRPGAVIRNLKGDILHYSFNSISDHINQINRFSDISARAKFQKGIRIPLLYTLVRIPAAFLKKYFLKLGFLDGYYGFIISKLTAYGVFLKDIKLKELYRKSKNGRIKNT